jgi:hypothetical protein
MSQETQTESSLRNVVFWRKEIMDNIHNCYSFAKSIHQKRYVIHRLITITLLGRAIAAFV